MTWMIAESAVAITAWASTASIASARFGRRADRRPVPEGSWPGFNAGRETGARRK